MEIPSSLGEFQRVPTTLKFAHLWDRATCHRTVFLAEKKKKRGNSGCDNGDRHLSPRPVSGLSTFAQFLQSSQIRSRVQVLCSSKESEIPTICVCPPKQIGGLFMKQLEMDACSARDPLLVFSTKCTIQFSCVHWDPVSKECAPFTLTWCAKPRC